VRRTYCYPLVLVACSLTCSALAPPLPSPVVAQSPMPKPPASRFVVSDDPAQARAVLTTMKGAEIPDKWPLGLALGVTAKQSARGDGAAAIAWDVEPAYVFEAAWPTDNGASLVISSGLQPVTVTIRVAVARGDTVSMVTKRVQFVDMTNPAPPPIPPAPPTPPPGPPPAPAPDASLTPLGQQFRSALVSNLPTIPTVKAELAALASNYEVLSGRIQSALAGNVVESALLQPANIEAEIIRLNRAVVSDRNAWLPAFNALSQILEQLDAGGKLSAPADYVTTYTAIGAALRSLK